MLVLTRKKNETIIVDGRITITVLRIKGNSIRLGIDAPASVPVRRGELPQREQRVVEFELTEGLVNEPAAA